MSFLNEEEIKQIFARIFNNQDASSFIALILAEDSVYFFNDGRHKSENLYLNVVPEKVVMINLCIYAPKEAKMLIAVMNHYIAKIRETGLLEKFRDDFTSGKNAYENHKVAKKLTLDNLLGGFYLYFAGLVIAVITFICEITIQRIKWGSKF